MSLETYTAIVTNLGGAMVGVGLIGDWPRLCVAGLTLILMAIAA